MKKIINGKMYNTETAIYLGGNEPITDRGNFRWYYEELYLKKAGEFFLAGEGNGLSKYSTSYGINEWGPGKGIIPLTIEEARSWVTKNLSTDDYIDIFGEPEE